MTNYLFTVTQGSANGDFAEKNAHSSNAVQECDARMLNNGKVPGSKKIIKRY